jgi:hypothetical protein
MKKQVIILSVIVIVVIVGTFGLFQYIRQLQETLDKTQETNTQLIGALNENMDLVSQYQASIEETDNSYQELLDALQNRLFQNSKGYKELLVSNGDIIKNSNIDTSSYVHLYSYDDNIMTFSTQYYLTDVYIASQIDNNSKIVLLEGLDANETKAYKELSVVIQLMSNQYFSFLPINIDKLETTEEGIIATINLTEIADAEKYPHYYSWKSGYFQGSSGGMYTQDTLIYNVLQPDKTDWLIDGVTFTYEKSPINQFEHVPGLSTTIMRSDLQ